MSARLLALVCALPLMVSGLGVSLMQFNRSGGREPFTLSEREVSANRLDGGRTGVTLWLSWSPLTRRVTPEYRRGFRRPTYAAFTIDPSIEEGSRLVPVDNDPDPEVLARRYPDGRTHLISAVEMGPDGTMFGFDPGRLTVPREFAAAVPVNEYPKPDAAYTAAPRFTVQVRYGRRWEPWVVGVSR
jgi:hypothetical protein